MATPQDDTSPMLHYGGDPPATSSQAPASKWTAAKLIIAGLVAAVILYCIYYMYYGTDSSYFLSAAFRSDTEADEDFVVNRINSLKQQQERNINKI
jgi:hypothetical protein